MARPVFQKVTDQGFVTCYEFNLSALVDPDSAGSPETDHIETLYPADMIRLKRILQSPWLDYETLRDDLRRNEQP